MRVTKHGKSAATIGDTVADGEITWKCIGVAPWKMYDDAFVAWLDEVTELSGIGKPFDCSQWAPESTLWGAGGLSACYPTARNGRLYRVNGAGQTAVTGPFEPSWPTTTGIRVPDNWDGGGIMWYTLPAYWEAEASVALGKVIDPGVGVLYRASAAGDTGSTEPDWGGASIVDGTVTWDAIASSDLPAIAETTMDVYFEKWRTACTDVLAAAGIERNFDQAGVNGDGCWQDYELPYHWAYTGTEPYMPIQDGHYHHECVMGMDEDGRPYVTSTKRWGFGPRWGCPEALAVGDRLRITISGVTGAGRSYQEGDTFTARANRATPLPLSGGQTGDDTLTWSVIGSEQGRLPDYALVTTAPSPYAWSLDDASLGFAILPAGIRYALGDRYQFAVEGGRFRWRRDGGAWSSPIDIGTTPLADGLTAVFAGGAAPSWVAGDAWSFVAEATFGADQLRQPTDGELEWVGSPLAIRRGRRRSTPHTSKPSSRFLRRTFSKVYRDLPAERTGRAPDRSWPRIDHVPDRAPPGIVASAEARRSGIAASAEAHRRRAPPVRVRLLPSRCRKSRLACLVTSPMAPDDVAMILRATNVRVMDHDVVASSARIGRSPRRQPPQRTCPSTGGRHESNKRRSGVQYLVFLGDGNLVVARKADDGYVWGTNAILSDFYATTSVTFRDGELSAWNEDINKSKRKGDAMDHPRRWWTPAPSADQRAGARVTITPAGVLQIVSGPDLIFSVDGQAATAGATPMAPPPAAAPGNAAPPPGRYTLPLVAGRDVKRGDTYTSASGSYALSFADDGNLQVLAGPTKEYIVGFYNYLGAEGPWRQAHVARMTPGGDFALFDQNGKQVWSTGIRHPSAGSQLVFSDKGALQVRRPNGDVSWSIDQQLSPSERQGGGTSGTVALDDEQRSILDTHNRLRALHGASALKWSPVLAAEAQQFANACVQSHGSFESRNGAGENLSAFNDETMADRVESGWYAEERQYRYDNPGFNKRGASQETQTGHLTQLVWAATTDLGCAKAECPGYPWKGFLVCRYWPAGNSADPASIGGEASAFRRNVPPKQ